MSFLEEIFEATQTDSVLAAARSLASQFLPVSGRAIDMQELLAAARIAGVSVRLDSGVPFDGRYQNVNGIEEIVLNVDATKARATFTLAHELGHMLIERVLQTRVAIRYRSESSYHADEEQLANAIAAEILMPVREFKSFFIAGLTFKAFEEARRFFGTSFSAVLRRAAEVTHRRIVFLNVIPARIFNVEDPCLIDDATIILPGLGIRRYREQVKIVAPPRCADLMQARQIILELRSPLGLVRGRFQVRLRTEPCQNADLLATF